MKGFSAVFTIIGIVLLICGIPSELVGVWATGFACLFAGVVTFITSFFVK